MSKINAIISESLKAAQESLNESHHQQAVIFDLDGTLFDNRHRLVYHETKQWDIYNSLCHNDELITPVFDALLNYQQKGYIILIWSARCESTRDVTANMLMEQGVRYAELRMRSLGDYRDAVEIKSEFLSYYQTNHPDVKYVEAWDDNDSILALWRSNNIPTTKVTLHAPEDDINVEHDED